MLAALLDIVGAEIGHAVRRLTGRAVAVAMAVVLLAAALVSGVLLFHLWLQQLLGELLALAVTGGVCAVLALVLLAIALRKKSRPRRPVATAAAAPPNADIVQEILAAGQRTLDESAGTVQQGSRDAMLAALLLAVVEGMSLGRKI